MYDVDGLDYNDKEVNSEKYTQITDQNGSETIAFGVTHTYTGQIKGTSS